MSGLEVVGAISAVIGILDVSIKLWKGAQKDAKFSDTFETVANRLPILQDTLLTCKEHFEPVENSLPADVRKGLVSTVKNCKLNAEKVEEIFKKTIPGENTEWYKRYHMVAKRLGKGSKVEELMAEMTKDAQNLVNYHSVKSSRPDLFTRLDEMLVEIQALEPSIPSDDVPGNTFNAYGGVQTVNTGSGSQYSNPGSGNQINYGGGGNPVFNLGPAPPANWLTDQLSFQGQFARVKRLNAIQAKDASFEWLWEVDTFVEWLSTPGKVFWITGKPASGKSTLMNYVANLKTRPDGQLFPGLADCCRVHFFFNYEANTKSDLSNTLEGLHRSILYQLCKDVPGLSPAIESTFDLRGELRDEWLEDGRTVTQILIFTFEQLRHWKKPIFLLLDGLDDYGGHLSDISEIVQYFTSKEVVVKLCVASRPTEFKTQFCDWPQLVLDQYNRPGIETHALLKFDLLYPAASPQEFVTIQAIATRISKLSDGIFLWAAFATTEMYDSLRRKESFVEQENRLTKLPATLTGFYTRIIGGLCDDKLVCGRVLELVASAKPLLFVTELFEACQLLGIQVLQHDGLVTNEALHTFVERLLLKTGGLIDLVLLDFKNDEGDVIIVQLAHRTLSDFLDHQSGWQKLFGEQYHDSSSVELWLNLCQAYLTKPLIWTRSTSFGALFNDGTGRPEVVYDETWRKRVDAIHCHTIISPSASLVQKSLEQRVASRLPVYMHDYECKTKRSVRREVLSLLDQRYLQMHTTRWELQQCKACRLLQPTSALEFSIVHGCVLTVESMLPTVSRQQKSWLELLTSRHNRIEDTRSADKTLQFAIRCAIENTTIPSTAATTRILQLVCSRIRTFNNNGLLLEMVQSAKPADVKTVIETCKKQQPWYLEVRTKPLNPKAGPSIVRTGPLWAVARRYPDEDTRELLRFFVARGERLTDACCQQGNSVHAAILCELESGCKLSHLKRTPFDRLDLLLLHDGAIEPCGPNTQLQSFLWLEDKGRTKCPYMDTISVPTTTDRPAYFYSRSQNSQFHFGVHRDDMPLGQDIREWRIQQNFLSSRPRVDCKHALLLEYLRDPIAYNQAQLEENALPVSRWAAEVRQKFSMKK
ncbi:hypothetical protein LTR64_008081 [Lithohypha guttulata]|uniref:uncharacterized protein n=1 Tax=Lithohypha guttulata TaxID=1690604 RepID=UPI002DE01F0F|nr:hypothetical protein LTR51_008049 [Lithohypha guttulata]